MTLCQPEMIQCQPYKYSLPSLVKYNLKQMAQLILNQCSPRTYSITQKRIPQQSSNSLTRILKSHHATWNHIFNLYELPIEKFASFYQAVDSLFPGIPCKEPPKELIRNLISHFNPNMNYLRASTIQLKKQWKKMLVLDFLMIKRFPFCYKRFLERNTASHNRKVLLVCSQVQKNQWEKNLLLKYKVNFKNVDNESFDPRKVEKRNLAENQFDLYTYEQLEQNPWDFTSQSLAKYSTIICDDCELWLSPLQSRYGETDLTKAVRNLLQSFGQEKEIVLFAGMLSLSVEEMVEVGSIFSPQLFTIEVKSDLNWRYKEENKRELFFLYESTFLVNLLQQNSLISQEVSEIGAIFSNNIFGVQISKELKNRIKEVDNKYKNVNQKQVINSIQNPRYQGTFQMSSYSQLEESNYWRDQIECLTNVKENQIEKWLIYFTKELKQRVAVVVENERRQKIFEKMFKKSNIKYTVYELDTDLSGEPTKTFRLSNHRNINVILIVRDKLLREVKRYEREKENLMTEMIAEQEYEGMDVEHGQLFQMLEDERGFTFSKFYQQLELPKITYVRHILFVDTFLQAFSEEKEFFLNNLFNSALTYVVDNKNQQKKMEMVRHFFLLQGVTNEGKILTKYLENVKFFSQSLKRPAERTCEEIWQRNVQKIKDEYKGCEVIEEIYDIDEEMDKIEFQAMKEREEFEKEKDKPVYNTKIEGLEVEATLLKKEEIISEQSIQQKGEDSGEGSRVKSSEKSSFSESSSENIEKYLIKEKKPEPHLKSEKIESRSAPFRNEEPSYPFMRINEKMMKQEPRSSVIENSSPFIESKPPPNFFKDNQHDFRANQGQKKSRSPRDSRENGHYIIARKLPTIRVKLVEYESYLEWDRQGNPLPNKKP